VTKEHLARKSLSLLQKNTTNRIAKSLNGHSTLLEKKLNALNVLWVLTSSVVWEAGQAQGWVRA
jgi:hypothetical protein